MGVRCNRVHIVLHLENLALIRQGYFDMRGIFCEKATDIHFVGGIYDSGSAANKCTGD